MRLLHYIEIENFKTFGGKQRIELHHPAVIIGPNNCGKTSVLQALALWGQAVRTWQAARANTSAKERTGTALNRLTILNVPVQRTRFFWHGTKVRTGQQDIYVTITVGVEIKRRVERVAMRFKNYGEDLIYCSPDDSTDADLLAEVAKINVELLYPMSGLETEEPVLQPGRVGVLLGQGQTAQVLRNLCLIVHRASPQDWNEIAALMQRLFHIQLGVPQENARGAIELDYEQADVKEPLALSSSGRGFQQMLLILAYLYSHKGSVLLVDEPDAHLEILRQQQVFVLLRNVAEKNKSQVVMVTHSEVIVDAALDSNLTLLLDGQADDLASKADIKTSLKIYGTPHYIRARQKNYVLYVEGGTDLENLRAIAGRLRHRVAGVWDESPNVYFVESQHPEPTLESAIEGVEGGFGVAPKTHFNSLRKLIPSLRGLAILDNDGHNREQFQDERLNIVRWERYEIENYFVTPQVLLDFVAGSNAEAGLFAVPSGDAQSVLEALILERVFARAGADLRAWQDAPPEAARVIWEQATKGVKLSDLAEEFFRRLSQQSGLAMLLTKGEFHRLVHLVPPAAFPIEVNRKLDLLAGLFEGSTD
jgi:predicted ATPase